MVFLAIFLSLFSFLVISMLGGLMKRAFLVVFAISLPFLGFLIIIISYFSFIINGETFFIITDCFWIDIGLCQVEWIFLFDSLSMSMLVLITFISFLVHVYSCEYMQDDPHFVRFISYLGLFTFFMELLVTSGNFLILFLGWEGVGLSSFLLISFWFERPAAVKSAIKAIIVNRIGDVGLLLGISVVFFVFRTLDFSVIFLLSPFFKKATLGVGDYDFLLFNFICVLFFLGVIGKSAQIGLHVWLPDAMEGPTPVSALIHAATMVTAGVFFLVRCSVIFELAPTVLVYVSFIGGLTAFISATIAAVQNDLKKVIAYSTCSQLGYMVFSCGLSHYTSSIYHLINHGFFKALLFLGAGVIIHAVGDEQDMRKMGGLISFLPFTFMVMVVGSLSLGGFPFLTGFYSKDLIIELAFVTFKVHGFFCYFFSVLSALLTIFYSVRLLFLVFLDEPKGFKRVYITGDYLYESSLFISLTLFVLCLCSIFFGFFFKELFVGVGTLFWGNSIVCFGVSNSLIYYEFVPLWLKTLPLVGCFLGLGLSFSFYYFYYGFWFFFNRFFFFKLCYFREFDDIYYRYGFSRWRHDTRIKIILFLYNRFFFDFFRWLVLLYDFLSNKWYFDFLINNLFLRLSFIFSYEVVFLRVEKGLFEILGAYGLFYMFQRYIIISKGIQSGFLYNYIFMYIVGFVGLFSLCFFFKFGTDFIFLISAYLILYYRISYDIMYEGF